MPRAAAAHDHAPAAPTSGAAREHDSSAEGIAREITAAIAAKKLPPGTWLREEALGRVYAVSRTKIRAALLLLSKDKLIEMIPDKGAFVSRPSVDEARQVFAVRRLLESEVVRLYVQSATAADNAALQQHIRVERAMHAGGAEGSLQEKLLGDFHVALAERCGNPVLADLVRELVGRSSLITMLYSSDNDPACATDEHEAFLTIAGRGDADAAIANMVEHLVRVESSLHLAEDGPARPMDLVKALLA
ncbi:MAG: GntR family transcriptional regulator [Proteobacteria bacterium]|nr:GntR family transcriptional regulator [Pseudomonadota bacterium]